MPAHRIYFHITWSTRDRRPMIDSSARDFLESFIRRTSIAHHVSVLALGILRSHVHLVIQAKPKHDLPELLQHLKGGSSHAINRLPGNVLGLRWNSQYSITTVSPRLLKDAIRYVEDQHRRHPDEAIPAESATLQA